MDGRAFYDAVAANSSLTWLGVKEAPVPQKSEVFVLHRPTDQIIGFTIETITAQDNDWNQLEDILERRRTGIVLHCITRIVGYFSQTHNWNGSKMAELADRRRGNYAVPGASVGSQSAGSRDKAKVA